MFQVSIVLQTSSPSTSSKSTGCFSSYLFCHAKHGKRSRKHFIRLSFPLCSISQEQGWRSPKDSGAGHMVTAWPWGHLGSSLMVCLQEPSARGLGTVPAGRQGLPCTQPMAIPCSERTQVGCVSVPGVSNHGWHASHMHTHSVSALTQEAEHRSVTVSGVLLWIAASCNLLFPQYCTVPLQDRAVTAPQHTSALSSAVLQDAFSLCCVHSSSDQPCPTSAHSLLPWAALVQEDGSMQPPQQHQGTAARPQHSPGLRPRPPVALGLTREPSSAQQLVFQKSQEQKD